MAAPVWWEENESRELKGKKSTLTVMRKHSKKSKTQMRNDFIDVLI